MRTSPAFAFVFRIIPTIPHSNNPKDNSDGSIIRRRSRLKGNLADGYNFLDAKARNAGQAN